MDKERLLPLTGLLFVVLLVASFFIAGEPPDADEDVQEIIDHYVDNEERIWISLIAFLGAAASLLTFASYLRKVFTEATAGTSILPGLVLVGASIIAVGGAIDATIAIALVEAVEDIEPSAVQALQALWDNDFVPIALGILVFILFSGLAALRSGALPKWLGWVAVAIGVLSFTPIGFFAFPAAGLWVIVVSILLSVRAGRATA